jgi:hypothetical protein
LWLALPAGWRGPVLTQAFPGADEAPVQGAKARRPVPRLQRIGLAQGDACGL